MIALLGTKIKFPVTRSIILQNSSNVKRDKLRINLEKLNQKLNEKLQVIMHLLNTEISYDVGLALYVLHVICELLRS